MTARGGPAPATLAAALGAACRRWPDRTAIEWNGGALTYRDLDRAIAALAAHYDRLGVRAGDRVACRLGICPAHLVAAGAAWSRGAVHFGLDDSLTDAELAGLVALTTPAALVSAAGPGLRTVGGRAGPRPVLVDPGSGAVEGAADPGCDGVPPRAPAPGDPAVLFATSGTTGAPKAAVSLQGNLAERWMRLAGAFRLGPEDVHLAQLPLAHGYGLMTATIGLLTGGRLLLLSRFRGETALRAIASAGVSVIHGSPAHYSRLLEALDGRPCRLGSLRVGSGSAAHFPPELVRAILGRLPIDFMLMYGSSEGIGVGTMNRDDLLRGAVGRPAQGTVEVRGPGRRPVRRGEVGEIVFSRRAFPVRYWGAPGAEQSPGEADDWYRSGDLGRLDDEGRLYVLGRLGLRINRGGLKIDPHEVERRLAALPGIAEAAVVGFPHPELGEGVCACVVAREGAAPDLGALRTALGRTLARHKLPERLCVLDQLPRLPTGKVDVRALRRAAAGAPSAVP